MKIFQHIDKRFVPIHPTPLTNEAELQELIERDPTVLPVPLSPRHIVVREFSTTAGRMDHLVVDDEASIVVVEAKLARNSTRRSVVAQAIDYAAQLAKWDAISLVTLLQAKAQGNFPSDWFTSPAQRERWLRDLQANLTAGRLSIVVLMDEVNELLKDAVRFLNRETPFSVLVGEVRVMRLPGAELLGLEVYGAEIVTQKRPMMGGASPPLTDEAFLVAKEEQGLRREGEAFLGALEWASEQGYPVRRTPRTLMLGTVSQDSLQWYLPSREVQIWVTTEKLSRMRDALSRLEPSWGGRIARHEPDPSRTGGLLANIDVRGLGRTEFEKLCQWYAEVQGFVP